MSDVTKQVGMFIAKARTGRALSVSELARMSGVAYTTLVRIEAGASPQVKTLGRLALALGLSPNEKRQLFNAIQEDAS